MRFILAILAVAFIAPVRSSSAQTSDVGALEGTVHDRSATRSVTAARVSARRMEPDSAVRLSAAPDARGRYRLDSVPPGRYQVRVASASLDSLRVDTPPVDLRVEPGRVVLADFTVPSGLALRDAVCGGRQSERRGAVAGRALDADADGRPLVGADLVASWMDFPLDGRTRRSAPTRRTVVVKTGPEGEYRVCGVPTETLFTLQLRSQGRAGAVVRLLIGEDDGAIARDLSLSTRTAPTIAEVDSVSRIASVRGRETPREELQTVGTAELSGVVRGLSSEPLANARVRVRDARSSVVTDSTGRFVLRDLPAGTQMLVVQRTGYAVAELPVELRPGRRVERAVLLVRPLSADALQSSLFDPELEAFDASRRTNPYGQYLTQEQIDKKKHATETVDLFDDLLGFTAFGHGPSARVISNMALASNAECTEASVIIQGRDGRRINDVAPGQIAGVEAYSDAAFVPGRFADRADCGVVVIWLRRTTRPAVRPAVGLRANGYP